MKKILAFFVFSFFAFNAQARVTTNITIVACEPEWASLAREIAKNKADIHFATRAQQNPSVMSVDVRMKELFARADMVFCSGDGLEAKWLDRVIKQSNNIKVPNDKNAYFLAADYAKIKSKVEEDSAAKPRVHLNPHNIGKIAEEFTNRIKKLDPTNAGFYQSSYEDFMRRWEAALKNWDKQILPLKDMKVVIIDDSWLELTNWMKLKVVAKIEPKKGIVANTQNLDRLVKELAANPADAIIISISDDKDTAFALHKKTKTKMVVLPLTIGGVANTNDLFQLFDATIRLLSAQVRQK